MSTALAIACVTRTLRSLIDQALQLPLPANLPADVLPTGQMTVTTLPLDRVRTVNATGNVLNLYLYSTVPNPSLRNAVPPSRGADLAAAPLALNLHYMLTAYGQDDNELIAQFMLGRAMLALHDNTVLSPSALADALAGGNVQDQIDRVRITPHPLGFEEMSKLWLAYQTQYRLSSAYEASVVLMDSARPASVAPPVRTPMLVVKTLQRPAIDSLSPQIVAPGDSITLQGANLGDPSTQVKVGALTFAPDSASASTLAFTLPASTPAGVGTVKVVQQVALGVPPVVHPGVGIESNAIAFMLSPVITTAMPMSVARGAVLQLAVSPPVGLRQQVVLLLDDIPVPQQAHAPGDPATSTSVSFAIPANFAARSYMARVMVDGAPSPLTIDTVPASPTFNQAIGPVVTLT